MKTLYIRISEDTSLKIEALMQDMNCSSQKAGEHILQSFFEATSKEKSGMEKARDAVEKAKIEAQDGKHGEDHINHALIEFMEGVLDANGG